MNFLNLLKHCKQIPIVILQFILSISLLYIGGTDREWEEECAQIRVMLDPAVGAVSRPILVLSCVSRETADRRRIPCVTIAHQLQLSSLPNPWMVRHQTASADIIKEFLTVQCTRD